MGELQIGARLKEFEDPGIDQVIFLSQAGRIPHEMPSSSIELFGSEALPEVNERDPDLRCGESVVCAIGRKRFPWFTEGFDTADLKDAKALLDELS